MITMKVDTSAFDSMVGELAEVAKAPPERVLREEVGKILEKAIEDTPAMDVGKVRARSRDAWFTLQDPALYTPKAKVRRNLKKGRVLYNLRWRYPPQLWHAIQRVRATDLAKKIKARGLAKQSWLKIALGLGIAVKVPSYAATAEPTTGKTYPADETTSVVRGNGTVTYQLENAQPTINAIDGEAILQKAIDGRVLYFVNNAARQVFDDLAKTAKKYPGITVIP